MSEIPARPKKGFIAILVASDIPIGDLNLAIREAAERLGIQPH
jgi:hypothetical protein